MRRCSTDIWNAPIQTSIPCHFLITGQKVKRPPPHPAGKRNARRRHAQRFRHQHGVTNTKSKPCSYTFFTHLRAYSGNSHSKPEASPCKKASIFRKNLESPSRAIANGPDLGDTVRPAGALRICKLGTEQEKIHTGPVARRRAARRSEAYKSCMRYNGGENRT